MMFCTNCGTKNDDAAKFCQGCGQNLTSVPHDSSQDTDTGDAPKQVQYVKKPSEINSNNNVISQAWSIITANSNFVGRCFLLALIVFVPVLNFFVLGYLYCEAKNHIDKNNVALLPKIMVKEHFVKGFFIFVIFLCLYIIIVILITPASSLVYNSILANKMFGFLLYLIAIAAACFGSIMFGLMSVRVALMSIGPAFRFGVLFKTIKEHFAACVVYIAVPFVISVLIYFVLAKLFSVLTMLFYCSCYSLSFDGIFNTDYGYSTNFLASYFRSSIEYLKHLTWIEISLILLSLVFTYLTYVVMSLCAFIWSIAQGRFVGQFAMHWVEEASVYEKQRNNYRQQQAKMAQQAASQTQQQAVPNVNAIKLVTSQGQELQFNSFPVVIGSDPNVTLAINGDSSLEPQHASIGYSNGQLALSNISSSSIVVYNGVEIASGQAVLINNGDKAKIGVTEFTLKF